MSSIKQDISAAAFRSATSVRSFESFLASLPKQMVHQGVSLLGRGRPASAQRAESVGEPGAHDAVLEDAIERTAPVQREMPKVGRNDPCPCGSGKKYKKCCGQ
jgi:preprotein translocase subunit SecA